MWYGSAATRVETQETTDEANARDAAAGERGVYRLVSDVSQRPPGTACLVISRPTARDGRLGANAFPVGVDVQH